MVWTELTDHLEVLYGAAAALVIVLLLTPAVGSAARYLRLVERRPKASATARRCRGSVGSRCSSG